MKTVSDIGTISIQLMTPTFSGVHLWSGFSNAVSTTLQAGSSETPSGLNLSSKPLTFDSGRLFKTFSKHCCAIVFQGGRELKLLSRKLLLARVSLFLQKRRNPCNETTDSPSWL